MLMRFLGAITFVATLAASLAAQAQFGPPELIEAAKKEGKLVLYTANIAETEQVVIAEFNKRFPFVQV